MNDVSTAKRDLRAGVTTVRQRSVEELLAPKERNGFPLAGFDDAFGDIVDYIFKITHWIWAEKSVGKIYDYYDHACMVYTAFDITRSVEEVVNGTVSMMQAFPDRESRFLNVAWSGDDKEGYYTSHLGFSQMTNIGPSAYGEATGRRVNIHTVADCVSRDNKIFREWLVRDNGAMVRQLGFDIHEVARSLADRDAAAGREPWFIGQPERSAGQALPLPLDRPKKTIEDRLAHMLHEAWNRRRFDALRELYDPAVNVHMAGGREITGVEGLVYHFIQIVAAFPNAVFSFDNYCHADEADGTIAAVRWSIRGHHRGNGLFGAPSGKPVYILGMSHFRFNDDKIIEEWTLYDELAILRQIYAHGPVRQED